MSFRFKGITDTKTGGAPLLACYPLDMSAATISGYGGTRFPTVIGSNNTTFGWTLAAGAHPSYGALPDGVLGSLPVLYSMPARGTPGIVVLAELQHIPKLDTTPYDGGENFYMCRIIMQNQAFGDAIRLTMESGHAERVELFIEGYDSGDAGFITSDPVTNGGVTYNQDIRAGFNAAIYVDTNTGKLGLVVNNVDHGFLISSSSGGVDVYCKNTAQDYTMQLATESTGPGIQVGQTFIGQDVEFTVAACAAEFNNTTFPVGAVDVEGTVL